MARLKLQVNNSPFSEEQVKLLNELLPQLTELQKFWLNGYLSVPQAKEAVTDSIIEEIKEVPVEKKAVTILYGSQTGNSQALAEKLGAELAQNEVVVTISSLSKFKTNNLKKISNLLLVISTYGEGEPPDNAIQFYDFLHSKRAPKLDQLQYAVLALGDSSYELFCKTGVDFDTQFEKLGAKRILPRVDCDLDYDDISAEWITNVKREIVASESSSAIPEEETTLVGESNYSRKNPFYAEVLENINLNGRGSNKQTQHIELSLEGSNLTFEPGDSIGIFPNNDETLVKNLIETLQLDENEQVNVQGETVSLKEALQSKLEITVLSKPLLQKIATYTDNKELTQLIDKDNDRKDYVEGRDLLDVVEQFGPFTWSAQQLVELLRKIPARLYSIASSQKANEEEVHLTIGKVGFEKDGRERFGVCSGEVADRIVIGDKLPIYVHANPNFKLPKDDTTPIILIGAGTGIAPFRSFIEERAELGSEGKSWLFFGDQHFVTDFLYQTEWQTWITEGALTNLTVAFSRDTDQKVYVQHRLQENATEVYEWLQQGAVIYVCGDEKTMAADVDKTLRAIVEQQGGKTADEADQYINELKDQQRYQRDVY